MAQFRDGFWGEPIPPYWLEIGGRIVASLHCPVRVEMFWTEWEVRPFDSNCDARVREPIVWQEVAFRVLDDDGIEPNEHTLTGNFDAFCNRQSNRLSFRSLLPREWDETDQPKRSWLKRLSG